MAGLLANSVSSSVLQLVGGLIVFIAILFGARYAAKFIGQSNGTVGLKGKNLDIVESRAVGVGASVSVVRAGGKYFLVGVTKEKVQMLAELDAEGIEPPLPADSFKNVFGKFLGKNANGNKGDEL